MSLTESYAMLPAASVSGFYLAHPEATYFAVGKIAEDQIEDFARRSGRAGSEATRSLVASLQPTAS
jgi:5-methyltetrahydrofolate--homocysteine methyltransferase